MGFEIAPGDSPEDWRFDGQDWVKPDEDGVPWVWDGEEYGIKDGETGRTMVERDDGIYLKGSSGKLIASENPKTGEWQYFDQQAPNPLQSDSLKNLQPPNRDLKSSSSGESLQATTIAPSSPSVIAQKLSSEEDPPQAREKSPKKSSEKSSNPPSADLEQFIRRFWCRDDNSVEIRGFTKNPQCLDYNIAMVEHLRQIQYICKRILRANYQAGGIVTPADQVLCAIAITIVDLFDPASAEIARLLQSNDLQIFEPMRNRAMCLLKNRLQCCLHQ